MKKLIAILLCFVTLLALFSCDEGSTPVQDDKKQTETDEKQKDPSSQEEISTKYFKLEPKGGSFYYEIYDKQGRVVQSKLIARPTEISMLGESVVDIKIGRGAGLPLHTYYDVETDRFSEEFSYVVAASGNLVAYLDTSVAPRTLVVCDIFDRTVFERSYALDFDPWAQMPIQSASFTEGEKELNLVYFSDKLNYPAPMTLDVRYEDGFESYDSILRVYRKIIEKKAATLDLTEETELQYFQSLFDAISNFPWNKDGFGHAIKDINSDGVEELVLLTDDYCVIAVFSMVDGTPMLLDHYHSRDCSWIDSNGRLHVSRQGGTNDTTHTVYQIEEGGASLALVIEFGINGVKLSGGERIPKCYRTVNGKKTEITNTQYYALETTYGTYLDLSEGAAVTKDSSGLVFVASFSQDKCAQESFYSVLRRQRKVYEIESEEYKYLYHCQTPYMNNVLQGLYSTIYYDFVDMDGDGVREMIINCGGFLVFQYYEETVYVHSFTFREMNYVNSDGSFAWNDDTAYGESKLVFDGLELSTKEIWRVVNDGMPNAEYFVDGQQVTQAEWQTYRASHPTERVEGNPMDFGK